MSYATTVKNDVAEFFKVPAQPQLNKAKSDKALQSDAFSAGKAAETAGKTVEAAAASSLGSAQSKLGDVAGKAKQTGSMFSLDFGGKTDKPGELDEDKKKQIEMSNKLSQYNKKYAEINTKHRNDVQKVKDEELEKAKSPDHTYDEAAVDAKIKELDAKREEDLKKLDDEYDDTFQFFGDKAIIEGGSYEAFIKSNFLEINDIELSGVNASYDSYLSGMMDFNISAQLAGILDAANQMIAQIPPKIEDGVDSLQKCANFALGLGWTDEDGNDLFSQLSGMVMGMASSLSSSITGALGASVGFSLDPNSFDFNPLMLFNLISFPIKNVLSMIKPLTSLGFKIPLLGDIPDLLMKLIEMLFSFQGGGSGFALPDLKAMMPSLPEIPTYLLVKIMHLVMSIQAIMNQMPMLYINLILSIIKTMVKVIAKLIPGIAKIFPISLVYSAITVFPNVTQLMMTLPQQMFDMLQGIIRQMMAQAMALSMPSFNASPPSMPSLPSDIDPPAPQKMQDYADVNDQAYSNISCYGYSMYDLNTILNQYKKLYDGTNKKITLYEKKNTARTITIDGAEQGDSSKSEQEESTTTQNAEKNESENTFTTYIYTSILTRENASVQKYEQYMQQLTSDPDIATYLKYNACIPTRDVFNQASIFNDEYQQYKPYISEKGKYIAIQLAIEPSLTGKIGNALIGATTMAANVVNGGIGSINSGIASLMS